MADDAVSCELVSAPKFPANREINREFRKFRASAAISTSNQRANSKSCSQIPYATEQGIFAAITGNFFGITGNLIERAGKALKMHSPLLLSPALGQRAGELFEGEIGRRGALEQCRHDPG